MQATLNDLAKTRRNTQAFAICQHALHKCHEIIFGDLPPQASSPYSSLNLPLLSRFARKRVRPHVQPVLVGLGMILAGAPGMPALTPIMGEVAVEQGRVDDEGRDIKSFETAEDDLPQSIGGQLQQSPTSATDDSDEDVNSSEHLPSAPPLRAVDDHHTLVVAIPKTPLSRRSTITAAQTSPALPFQILDLRRSRASEDPLGQLDQSPARSSQTPSQSSPSLTVTKRHRFGAYNSIDTIMQKYDLQAQMHLLRGHFCRSEVRTFMTPISICRERDGLPDPISTRSGEYQQ